ncbi:MAG: glycosyltransferase family 39 protein [Deltaproteobacteria bacterium]|nr:glycosyltransferase family 39 protein [Deltaproteobacteria bacterium]
MTKAIPPPPDESAPTPDRAWIALVAIVAAQALVNAWFTSHMATRLYGDEVGHLQTIMWTWRHGPGQIWGGVYTPLYYLVATALHHVFGPSIQVDIAANIPFHAALVWGAHGIARHLTRSSRAGVVAAILVTTLPLAGGLSRMAMLDFASIGMVAMAFRLLLETQSFSDRRRALAFGVAAGLGTLTRDNFPILLLGPSLVEFVAMICETSPTRRRAKFANLAIAAGVSVAIALTWYGVNFANKIRGGAIRVTLAGNLAGEPIWSWNNAMFYPFTVADIGLGPWLFPIFVVAAIWVFARRSPARAHLAAFFALPWLVFSCLDWKLAHYVAPWACGFAAVMAAGLAAIPRARWRTGAHIAVVGVALAGWLGMATNAIPRDWLNQNGWWANPMGVRWTAFDYQQDLHIGPPRTWESTQIDEVCSRLGDAARGRERPMIVVRFLNVPTGVSDVEHPFAFPLTYTLLRDGANVEIKDVKFETDGRLAMYWASETLRPPEKWIEDAAYLIAPQDFDAPAFLGQGDAWSVAGTYRHLDREYALFERSLLP